MSKKGAAAFAIGLGQGLLTGKRYNDDKARQAKDDEWRDEQRQFQREQQQSARQERIALSDAVAPRTVVEGTAVDTPAGATLYKDPAQAQAAAGEAQIEAEMRGTPPLGAPRPAYGTTGMSLGNQITTEKPDVAALNSPDARMGRVVDATMRTDPAKAMSLQSAALGIKNTEEQMADRRTARAAAVKREGLESTFRAMQSKDPDAIFQAFNSQGDTKLKAPPQLVGTQKTKTPWGEIDDDVWSATVVGPDGSERQVKMSTMQVGQQLASVSDMLKDQGEARKLTLASTLRREEDRNKAGLQGAEKPPAGFRWTADGNLQAIPGGPSDPAIGGQIKPPPGYRPKPDGSLEAIPGGPADIKAGELGAKRTLQQKASVAQADRVISMVDTALSQVGGFSAGAGGVLANKIPGTTARDLQSNLETVKANLGFAELQAMRDASPTGGALGAIAVQELIALQSTVASLDQSQSPEQLKQNLDKIAQHYRKWKDVVQTSMDGGGAEKPAGGATGDWGDIPVANSPAEAAKLPSGSLFRDSKGVTRRVP